MYGSCACSLTTRNQHSKIVVPDYIAINVNIHVFHVFSSKDGPPSQFQFVSRDGAVLLGLLTSHRIYLFLTITIMSPGPVEHPPPRLVNIA